MIEIIMFLNVVIYMFEAYISRWRVHEDFYFPNLIALCGRTQTAMTLHVAHLILKYNVLKEKHQLMLVPRIWSRETMIDTSLLKKRHDILAVSRVTFWTFSTCSLRESLRQSL